MIYKMIRISLIALIAILGIVEAADRIEFECPEPDGLFPHPVQCDRYFHCRRGIVNRKLCADGLVFDPDKDATFEEPCDLVQESADEEMERSELVMLLISDT